MNKPIFYATIFLNIVFSLKAYSQDFDYVNTDENVSYDMEIQSPDKINISLYEINTGGIKVPIFLSYDPKGAVASELPSSVGFNWKLNAGGMIHKTINHLLDESEDGWLFHDNYNELISGIYYGGINENEYGKRMFETVDTQPDYYDLTLNDGRYISYLYERNNSGSPIARIINQSGDFNRIHSNFSLMSRNTDENEVDEPMIEEYIYQDNRECEIKVIDNMGVNYLFRRGVKRNRPYDFFRVGRPVKYNDYQNYYLHNIYTEFNNEEIKFEYITTKINKLIYHSNATRHQTNSDPQDPPLDQDEIVTRGGYQDISIEDRSRKDISKIVTDKEVIIFKYKTKFYYNSFEPNLTTPSESHPKYNQIVNQKINFLDEIMIYDHNNNYISGYKFQYTRRHQDGSLNEGELKIKHILKYGKNHKDFIVYKKFDYYPLTNRVSAVSAAVDVFGFPNNAYYGNQCPDMLPILYDQCTDRLPNESEMIKGMLKSITNTKGGKTTFHYIENSYGDIYYGGLLINQIQKSDNDNLLLEKNVFEYDDPEGFGLAIYENWHSNYPGDQPPNLFEDGFYEKYFEGLQGWKTYFTQKDPQMVDQNLSYLTDYNIQNTPVALLKNTPLLDDILEYMVRVEDLRGLERFNQFTYGYFYKKVTNQTVNTLTDQPEIGKVINHYTPSFSGIRLGKKLKKTEYFDNSNNIQKEIKYSYNHLLDGSLNCFKFKNVHLNQSGPSTLTRYVIEDYQVYFFSDVLKNIEILEFDEFNNATIQKKTDLFYLNEGLENPDYNRVEQKVSYLNDTPINKTVFKYYSEFGRDLAEDSQLLYELNPVFELNDWRMSSTGWLLNKSTVTEYYFNGAIKNIGIIKGNPLTGTYFNEFDFVSAYYNNGNIVSLAEEMVQFEYDLNGKIFKEKNLLTSLSKYYQRSNEYDGLFVDAVLTVYETNNLVPPYFLKKSFESSEENDVIEFSKAFSGKYVFNGNSLSLGSFPTGYQVTFWAYINDNWEFFNHTHNGGELTVNKPSGALYIDELRVQPKNSSLSSKTFDSLFGATSVLNERMEGGRREFDLFGRPLYYFDENQNIIKEFRYNNIFIDTYNQ